MLATSKAKRISIKAVTGKKPPGDDCSKPIHHAGGAFVLFAPSALAQVEAPTVEDLEHALARERSESIQCPGSV